MIESLHKVLSDFRAFYNPPSSIQEPSSVQRRCLAGHVRRILDLSYMTHHPSPLCQGKVGLILGLLAIISRHMAFTYLIYLIWEFRVQN